VGIVSYSIPQVVQSSVQVNLAVPENYLPNGTTVHKQWESLSGTPTWDRVLKKLIHKKDTCNPTLFVCTAEVSPECVNFNSRPLA